MTKGSSGEERRYEDWRIYMVANRVGTGKTFVALDDFAFRNIAVLVFVFIRFILAYWMLTGNINMSYFLATIF